MGPTFTLLTAGLLAAQTPAAPGCNCQKNAGQFPIQPNTTSISPIAGTSSSSSGPIRAMFRPSDTTMVAAEERPTFLSRLQGMFSKKSAEPEYVAPQEPPTSNPPVRMMQRLPAGQPNSVTPTVPAIPTSNPSPAPVKLQPTTYKAVPAGEASNVVNSTYTAPANTTILPASRPNRISPELVGKIGHENDYSWITGQLRIEGGVYVIHYATPEVVDRYNGSLPLVSDGDLRGFQDGDYVSVRGSVTGGNRPMYRLSGIDRLPR